MGLFSKRRTSDYQGFAKYTNEYNSVNQSVSAQNLQRAQSLSSASQAALAALQMHQKSPVSSAPPRARPPQNRGNFRANSLGGYQRANSMQSYTYTPKASYVTGPQQPQRSLSLRSNSLAGSVRSGQRSYATHSVFPEEEEYAEDEVVTTKTTKVLDAQGRTRSITTETIRQMPDGSNIIETKTTNISRSGSRANSLQGGPSHAPGNTYNLNKIEEDLSDFDYTYLDHVPKSRAEAPEPFRSPKTEFDRKPSISPVRPENRANSLASTQSAPRLKSILKSSSAANAAAAAAGNPIPGAENGHVSAQNADFRTDSETAPNGFLGLQPAAEIERGYQSSSLPSNQSNQSSNNYSNHQNHQYHHPPPTNRLASLTSGGNSIKFLDKVETIPYTYAENPQEVANDEKHKKQQTLQNNADLYAKALQVATEKVYGSPRSDAAPAFTSNASSPNPGDNRQFMEKSTEKKSKNDEKLSKVEASGVSKNYVYKNHHKDFTIRSLRDGGDEPHSSRKERAKEEKKQLKEEEKRHADQLKLAEKQRKQEEKEAKEAKKNEKTGFSLFRRKKRQGSVGESSLGSSDAKQSILSDQTAQGSKNEGVSVVPQNASPVINTTQQESQHSRIYGTPPSAVQDARNTSENGNIGRNFQPISHNDTAPVARDSWSPAANAIQSENTAKAGNDASFAPANFASNGETQSSYKQFPGYTGFASPPSPLTAFSQNTEKAAFYPEPALANNGDTFASNLPSSSNAKSFSAFNEKLPSDLQAKVPSPSIATERSHEYFAPVSSAPRIPVPILPNDDKEAAPKTPSVASKNEYESGHQLSQSQTLDEDDEDEFVDVPDNLIDEVDKRFSSIPLLDHDNFGKGKEAQIPLPAAAIPESSVRDDSRSTQSIKVPERTNLDHQPGTISAERDLEHNTTDRTTATTAGNVAHDVTHGGDVANDRNQNANHYSVPNIPVAEDFSPKSSQTEELPTLVSGANGSPQVVTKSDHYVFQPRNLEDFNDASVANDREVSVTNAHEDSVRHTHDDSVANTRKTSYEDAEGGPANFTSKGERANEYHQGILDKPELGEPFKSSVVLGSIPDANSKAHSPVGDIAAHPGLGISSGSVVNVEAAPVQEPEPQYEDYVPTQNDARVQPERRNSDSSVKSKAKKKVSKFKKVIEKYFLNSYSR